MNSDDSTVIVCFLLSFKALHLHVLVHSFISILNNSISRYGTVLFQAHVLVQLAQ